MPVRYLEPMNLFATVSPWGTQCGSLPGGIWVRKFMKNYGSGGPTSDNPAYPFRAFWDDVEYKIASSASDYYGGAVGETFSGTLNDHEKERVGAAFKMLASQQGQKAKDVVLDALRGFGILANPLRAAFDRFERPDSPDPRSTIIGKNDEKNPFYRLAFDFQGVKSGKTNSKGKILGGLNAPGSFVFPLVWSEAMSISYLDRGNDDYDANMALTEALESQTGSLLHLDLALDDDTRTSLASVAVSLRLAAFADIVYTLKTAAQTAVTNDATTGEVNPAGVAGLLVAYSVVQGGLIPVFVVAETFKQLVLAVAGNILGDAADSVQEAAGDGLLLNDSAASLLDAVGQLPSVVDTIIVTVLQPIFTATAIATLGLASDIIAGMKASIDAWAETNILQSLTGVSDADMAIVASTLRSDWQGTDSTAVNSPVIHLGSEVLGFYYDGYRAEPYAPTGHNSWPTSSSAGSSEEYARWAEQASPTLQFAFVVTLASEILLQTMNMYSAPLALSETASTYSPVGTLVRGQLADAGLSCLVDVFGGVSFSRFVAVMYRQVIVDRFIASWVAEGGAPDCLYEIFCWMADADKRDAVDRALGPVDSDGERDFATGALGQVFGAVVDALEEGEFDPSVLCALWAALPCEDREAVAAFVESATCLFSLFDGLSMPDGADTGRSSGPLANRVLPGFPNPFGEPGDLPGPFDPGPLDPGGLGPLIVPWANPL